MPGCGRTRPGSVLRPKQRRFYPDSIPGRVRLQDGGECARLIPELRDTGFALRRRRGRCRRREETYRPVINSPRSKSPFLAQKAREKWGTLLTNPPTISLTARDSGSYLPSGVFAPRVRKGSGVCDEAFFVAVREDRYVELERCREL